MGLVYQPYQSAIIAVEDLTVPGPNEEEESYRELWRLFYDAIEVEGRHNPQCRMSHMPKRYWTWMTEFDRPQKPLPQLEFPAEKSPLAPARPPRMLPDLTD
jgi:hypothetical protein